MNRAKSGDKGIPTRVHEPGYHETYNAACGQQRPARSSIPRAARRRILRGGTKTSRAQLPAKSGIAELHLSRQPTLPHSVTAIRPSSTFMRGSVPLIGLGLRNQLPSYLRMCAHTFSFNVTAKDRLVYAKNSVESSNLILKKKKKIHGLSC